MPNAYYLDWNNNNNTTEANVNKLFDNFWQRDEQTLALHTLKLKADASLRDITRSYRQLASQYHPDKGGDTEAFIHIRQAYELLRKPQLA